ncbi:hypothetical protein [Kitasatospora sp. NPDC096140]|uniref:hypothetical protein n=1 Tax=Kitasatospora sp. NPDC096140 TaxID=3155425 RepID=UPI003328311A
MSVPELIPIRHEPEGRTRTIGCWRDGAFFASVTGPVDRPEWYAVLHRFDSAGQHLDSAIRSAGTGPEARRLLEEWLDALPGREYGSIAIAPFEVRFDGVLFGLVIEEDDEADEHDEDGESGEHDEDDDEADRFTAELHPDGLGFHAPWCGCYDT